MGLILDSSVLIGAERGRIRLDQLFSAYSDERFFVAAITASELLHGVERAVTAERKAARGALVEQFLLNLEIIDFDLIIARRHAALWASLEQSGKKIGAHDLIIAATALSHGHSLATLDVADFERVPGLLLVGTKPFMNSEG